MTGARKQPVSGADIPVFLENFIKRRYTALTMVCADVAVFCLFRCVREKRMETGTRR
jgi:hypothetical protein